MITTWVLVIVFYARIGGVHAIQIDGYSSQEACVEATKYISDNSIVSSLCLPGPVKAPEEYRIPSLQV